jgi:hypothetical protein
MEVKMGLFEPFGNELSRSIYTTNVITYIVDFKNYLFLEVKK